MLKIKYHILYFLFLLVEKTCAWKYIGENDLKKAYASNRPTLICVWHGQFIFPLIYFKKTFTNIKVVSSNHKDSMVLARVLIKYGFSLIKGSSSKGGKNVIKNMIALYKNKDSIVVVTNDGPKGPAKIAKQGSVALANKMNANILFTTGRASRFWTLKTWDRFVLPKPFATNTVYFNKIEIPKSIKKENVASFITDAMNKIENDIDKNNL